MIEFYVDADACPVKNEVFRVAERYRLKVNIVSNTWLRLPFVNVPVSLTVVEKTPDAADDKIAQNVRARDVVITADIPLASRCLAVGAFVVKPNGDEFTQDNIGDALGRRGFNAFMREIGTETRNPPFTQKERSHFLNALENITRKAMKKVSG